MNRRKIAVHSEASQEIRDGIEVGSLTSSSAFVNYTGLSDPSEGSIVTNYLTIDEALQKATSSDY